VIVRIASDWHLGTRSPAEHGRLARAFLERARADGARVVLNGDVFDLLFDGEAARFAHPEVVAALGRLAADGALSETAGNHDPEAGPASLLLDVPPIGRVLVAHGHLADPINRSPVGRLGDEISMRYGRLAIVRGAARVAERVARAVAGAAMVRVFRTRCLAFVAQEGAALGIFGHVHVAHLAAGDRYANAGALRRDRLEYLELGPDGATFRVLTFTDPGSDASAGIPRRPPG
jgi:hypothetical protein